MTYIWTLLIDKKNKMLKIVYTLNIFISTQICMDSDLENNYLLNAPLLAIEKNVLLNVPRFSIIKIINTKATHMDYGYINCLKVYSFQHICRDVELVRAPYIHMTHLPLF